MKLASDIEIDMGGVPLTLRPSLCCAVRLERRPGGIHRLLRDVADDSYGAALEIILPHVVDKVSATQIAAADIPALRPHLMAYLMACAGIDPDDTPADKPKRKTITITEQLADLYKIGTGWLGWSPAETMDATPAEIMEAYSGRLEMLKAIFGSGDDKAVSKDSRTLNEKFRSIFVGYGTVTEA